jgi:hypothetical protein
MNRIELEQKFNAAERATIKKFLELVNYNSLKDSEFADILDVEQLNQFSDVAESDEDLKANVKKWLRLKKVRLRGAFTPDN